MGDKVRSLAADLFYVVSTSSTRSRSMFYIDTKTLFSGEPPVCSLLPLQPGDMHGSVPGKRRSGEWQVS